MNTSCFNFRSYRFAILLILSLGLKQAVALDFTYTVNTDDTLTLTGYTGLGGDVIIPSTIDNLTVSTIGSFCFAASSPVVTVTIPDSLKNIADSAFFMVDALVSVSIGNGVTNIGSIAFASCHNLTNITLGSSIVSIGRQAFQGCKIQNINIPNGVSKIEQQTFYYCTSLTNVSLGNGMKIIGESAFENCQKLRSVIIPDSVSTIGKNAFAGCTSLQSIVIPNNVEIRRSAFMGSGLTNVILGAGVAFIPEYYDPSINLAFANCSNLKSVFFLGNAPYYVEGSYGFRTFEGDSLTIYCYQNTTGWGTNLDGFPVVTLSPETTAPSITNQPQSVIAAFNGTASFNITAVGTLPLHYQWYLNNSLVTNATTSSLVVIGVKQSDLGAYSVVVSNDFGAVTSSVANLSMAPHLVSTFNGLISYWGQTNTLNVTAWGSSPLSFQWIFNGVAIPDATNSTLTLSSIQFTNAGFYSVVISNFLGSITNAPHQLIVNPANISLGMFPGVIINGTVGFNYDIQGTVDLSDTNSWTTLTNITLTAPLQIWSDYGSDSTKPSNPRKFYRVLPGQ